MMTSNDELLYYMLGHWQVNQERDWDLPQALCATDSDGGDSKPGPTRNYVPGDHRQQNATAKRANYVGDNARFTGI